MFRCSTVIFAAALSLVIQSSALAGGPPWLCLPVDGVTAENAAACGELLTSKLEKRLSEYRRPRQVEMRQQDGQWYLTFYMEEDVSLSDIDAALVGSPYSIPRKGLHLFGHVVLQIERGKSLGGLSSALEAMNNVSVAELEERKDLLVVTVDMPYPLAESRPQEETLAWEKFGRTDFSSDQATRSEPPTTADKLPTCDSFRQIVARHGGKLQDISFDVTYACRPQGGVAVGAAGSRATTAARR